VRHACIRRHEGAYAVALMCRVLHVSRGGYYAWRGRPTSARIVADVVLTTAIRAVHATSRRTYGSPRVHAELRATGTRVGRKRVARLMRRAALVARPRRRFVVTTQSAHAHVPAPNVLDRQFAIDGIGGSDRVWASDMTYLPTREGWLYLAVVLDLGSRRVVGWAMRHTLERGLTLDALAMALAHRVPGRGVLHHSDRGSQYACGDYRARLDAAGMICSMSKPGDCWDNAVAESFFATLKTELAASADWATREAARAAVFEYVEVWYNRHRRHSALGYVSPMHYEQMQMDERKTA
jgi:putative transposase